MIHAWTNIDSHAYGMMTLSIMYSDGSNSVTYVQLPQDCVVHNQVIMRSALPELPIGIETVPQLELRLRLTPDIVQHVITPLAAGRKLIVALSRSASVIVAGLPRIVTAPYDEPQIDKVLLFLGVVNTSIEVDLIKDNDTRLIVDEISHYAASELNAAELLNELATNNVYDRITTNDSWYDLHPASGLSVGTFAGQPITGARYFDAYNITSLPSLLSAIASVIAARIAAYLPAPMSALISTPTIVVPDIVAELKIGSTTNTYMPHEIYIQTDYRSSDSDKRYWGLCQYIRDSRSIRDALREFAESLLHYVVMRSNVVFSSPTSGTIGVDINFYPPLDASSGAAFPLSAMSGYRLFYSVISSVTVTASYAADQMQSDYTVHTAKRWNDYGMRLAAHNVPLAWTTSRGYIRYEGSNQVRRPEPNTYNRMVQRGMYVYHAGAWIRPMRIRSRLARNTGALIGDQTTIDGVTYTQVYTSVPQLSHDMRHTAAYGVLTLFSIPSQSLVEYTLQRCPALMPSLGTKYGIDYLLSSEVQVYSGRATWRMIRHAT